MKFSRLITLTIISAIAFSAAPLRSQNALNFDGTNDFVQTTFGGVFGTTNRTFEAWINVNSGITSNSAISDYGANAVGSRNTFYVSPNYQLGYISGGTNANIGSTTNAITPGQWTHVALVINSGTGYLYVNGVQVGTGSLTTVNTPSTGTNFRIGQRVPGGSILFEGSIDEVRVWNYARSVSEINNSMNDEFCSIPSGLVGYFKLNEGTAGGSNSGVTTASNQSGSGNGTLNNFSLSGSTSNWVSGVSLGTVILTDSVTTTECDSFVSPSGNYTWYTAGTYYDTIASTGGCDSAITFFLSITNATSSTINENACSSFTSPSGNFTWTQSGTYEDIIQNSVGCDSNITINLSINNTRDTITEAHCDSYTSPSGSYTWSTSGTYLDTISNSVGCDSIITIELTIVGTSVSSSIAESACKSYTSPSGNNTWTTSGTYTDTLSSSIGCDSIVSITLTILNVDTTVTKSGTTLTSGAAAAVYQWIKCSNNSAISGETNQSFTPTNTGNYAVAVTQYGCIDTSDCFNVKIVGINVAPSQSSMSVYPNPTSGNVTIDLGQEASYSHIEIINTEGKVIRSVKTGLNGQIEVPLEPAAGLYTILLYSNKGLETLRVMKVE